MQSGWEDFLPYGEERPLTVQDWAMKYYYLMLSLNQEYK